MRASTFKAIATAAFAAMAASSVASAADIAPRYTKAPPPVVEVWTWDKFYVGGNVGYSWGRSDTSGTFYNNLTGVQLSPTESGIINLDGFVIGGQVGKNWQYGNWVVGVELDGQWTDQKGGRGFTCVTPAAPPGGICNFITAGPGAGVSPTTTFNQHIEWFVTLRPRVGMLVTPSALLYVTGGLAVAGINTDGVISGFTPAQVPTSVAWSNDATKWGWVVGAGVEARLGGNWTGKLEGLYMDYGSVSGSPVLLTSNPPLRFDYTSKVTDVVLRAGVNYHFGGPVVAKY
ncbi:outer membrane protein [Bradyrhizobium sp.]|uniref:outer membrane protein n=1 Tax=Bradyrhizobium sp. TaxID=376 RepID=UPI0027200A13|nr:outer membrane beta-barrel protein [Bradyrhizobium sp.]MDO9297447.1 outer membrane beta-barrel protein [Bradyrhizobium sp.]